MKTLAAFVARYFVVIVIAVLIVFSGVTCFRLNRAQAAGRAQAFKADSAIAVNDTTRAVNEKAKKVLGDSIAGVERRAWQSEIQRDALDLALRRVTAAMTNIIASVKDLKAVGTGKVSESPAGIRTAHFDIDSVPYHAKADVTLPAPPQSGTIALTVKLDAAKLGVRIQCGKAKDAGVRPATVTVSTPQWLTAEIDSSQFSPDVCNAVKSRWPWWVIPVIGGGGYALGKLF